MYFRNEDREVKALVQGWIAVGWRGEEEVHGIVARIGLWVDCCGYGYSAARGDGGVESECLERGVVS